MSDSNPKNILRPLPTAEARKERYSQSGRITEADVREYLGEVRQMQSKYMTGDELEAFMEKIEKTTRSTHSKEIDPANKPKKIKSKKKIESTDSIIVVDKKDNLSKVSTQEQGGESAGSGGSVGGFKDLAKSIGMGTLALGSFTFNKMFPTLGRLMAAFDNRIKKQDSDLTTVNASNQDAARQVSRSSVFLSRVVENQQRTNELLEQILNATGGTLTPPGAMPELNGNLNVDLPGGRGRGRTGGGQNRTPPPGGSSSAPPVTGPRASPAAASPRPGASMARTVLGIGGGLLLGSAAGAGIAMAATSPSAPTPEAEPAAGGNPASPSALPPSTNASATQTAAESAIPSLPTPPQMTREAVRRTSTPITEQEQAELFANRVLNIKAKDIIFKADRFEFDQPTAAAGGGGGGGAPPPFTSSAPAGGGGGGSVAGSAAAAGTSEQIQTVVQRILQDFPAVNMTSGLRPGSSGQHSHGTAADLSLRGLSQEQRATLIQNVTSGRYGNVGGLGTYNATGDLLHVDTRSGSRMAWGPNNSRTSLNQTPQWFQAAVMPWLGGAAAAGGGSQDEPRPGGEQTATPAPSTPSSGAQVAQASVQSETAVMQSQQISSSVGETPDQSAAPSGSTEQTATSIDPNDPGSLEPADSAQRYARLFNMAA
jgi:hypothetical protein